MRFFLRHIQLPSFHWPTTSLRNYLVVMTLLATVPISTLMSYQLLDQIRSQDRRLYEGMQRTAGMLTQSVNRELTSTVDALKLLSYSGELQRRQLYSFEDSLMRRPLWRESWSSIYLRSTQGTMLFDTDHPTRKLSGEDNPTSSLPPVEVGNPAVSNLIPGGKDNSAFTTVEVPVVINNAVSYILGARIPAGAWQQLISSAGMATPDLLSLHDREFRVAAHSKQSEQFVGNWGPTENQPVLYAQPAGTARLPSLGRKFNYVAWEMVPISGWRVVVGTPSAPIDQAHFQSIVTALSTILACLLLGVTLALLVARQMTQPLQQLAHNNLSRTDERISVREIAMLRDALIAARAQDENARALIRENRDELSKKADEFETLFASCPIGLTFAQDRACRAVQHNAVMQNLFCADATDGSLPHIKLLHQGRVLLPAQQPLQRAAALGQPTYGMELEIQIEGRTPAFIIVNAIPLLDNLGVSRGAISASVDITTRKVAEANLIHAEQRLRESQRLIDLAQETGHVGFFHYKIDEAKLTRTPGQAKLFGFSGEPGLDALRNWTRRISRGSWPRLGRALLHAFRHRHAMVNVEYCVFLPDGTPRWMSSRVRLIYGEEGELEHVIGVSVDMTEQKNAEHDRDRLIVWEQAARIEAEKINRAKDEFLAMLGHELRNPLSAIASGVEVLNRVNGESEVAMNARRIIERQTSHLAHMMDDMTDVARVLNGYRVTLAPLDLAALVTRVIASMQMAGGFNQHELVVRIEEVWVNGNTMRIEQIANNLLTNATKYTPAGGRIVVRVAPHDDMALLEIEDDGIGISDELLPRVFDLFVQGERSLDRRGGGMGIGLTLVQRLVEMHKGNVVVLRANPGTIMSVRIPAIAAPEGVRPKVETQRVRPQRIVAIEDNRDVLHGLETALRLEGHTVWTAPDGISGLALILERRPDIAIVDVGLPGLTGYEVAERAKEAGFTGRLLAVSGYGRARDHKLAYEAGFDRHFLKPVRYNELFEVINAM